jgi:hypothetical protein
MHEYTVPYLKAKELQKFHRLMSLYFFESGIAFTKIENPRLLEALNVLRPNITLPSRRKLGGSMLDDEYSYLFNKLNEKVGNSTYEGTLVTDGWTNVKKDPIVNYLIASCQGTYFLESFDTKNERHTGEWICDDIIRIMDKYPFKLNVGRKDHTKKNNIYMTSS